MNRRSPFFSHYTFALHSKNNIFYPFHISRQNEGFLLAVDADNDIVSRGSVYRIAIRQLEISASKNRLNCLFCSVENNWNKH